MLLIAAESEDRAGPIADVARDLNLRPRYFADPESFEEAMGGRSRRIVILSEEDISDASLATLAEADSRSSFGLIILCDRDAPQSSDRIEFLDRLAWHSNTEWLGPDSDPAALAEAARECRRRMLQITSDEIETALAEQQFLLQYQPKVDRADGDQWETREVEALLRWHHPEHGLLGPLEFLPEVEEFGMTGRVSEFVLDEVAGQLVRWREQGLDLNGCINLASSLLNDPDLPESLASIVERHEVDTGSFTLEVTEQDVKNSDAPHLKVLNGLRDRGFRISLDDFAAASSSLRTFEQLPFDEIKIHAAALERAQDNMVGRKVLAAVTGLAHNLGISVCAEGVEDEDTFEFLKNIKCDKMQGFLISEAVMPDIIRQAYSHCSDDIGNVA